MTQSCIELIRFPLSAQTMNSDPFFKIEYYTVL